MAEMTPQPGEPSIHHVYPIGDDREHVIGQTSDCWCGPHLYRLCSQCDSCNPDCWLCGGSGTVRIGAIGPGDRAIVVHHLLTDNESFTYFYK